MKAWLIIVWLWAQAVCAGEVMEVGVVFKDFVAQPAGQYRATLWMNERAVKIDTSRFTGGKTELIFLRAGAILYHVDHAAREYMEIDAGRMERAGEQMRAFLDGLKEKIGYAGAASSARDVSRVAAESGTWDVAGMTCRKHGVYSGAEKMQEVWAAAWKDAGIEERDMAALRELTRTYDQLFRQLNVMLGGFAAIPCDGINRVPGYPALIKQWSGKHLDYEIQLARPRRSRRADGFFALPEGYAKTWLVGN